MLDWIWNGARLWDADGSGGVGGETGDTAGDEPGGEAEAGDGEAEEGGEKPAGERTFTQADMNRQAQRMRADFNRRREREIAEALRAAGLDDIGRALSAAEARDAALDAREADITRRELRASAMDALASRGLPAALADALNYADPPSFQRSLEAVESAFRPALQEGIEQRLRGKHPPKASGGGNSRTAAYRAALGLPKQ